VRSTASANEVCRVVDSASVMSVFCLSVEY
jgi:hypothetical protein